MKRMLINATQEEELRMAMVDGQRLYDLNIEAPSSERKKANIYKGKITRIERSLEAAFVNYGAERHGFLPLKEISSEYFLKDIENGKPSIREVLKEGQDIVVQIDKEERGNKGAALTTFVSLAGRFIVLKPNKPRSGGVSRRITGQERDEARSSLKNVKIPDGMSVILRTAGIDRTTEELEWDLENLLNVWQAILKVVVERPSPFLIYRESNAVVRALRDYLTNDIGEILIDDEATYVEARDFVEQVMPHNQRKLKHYTDPVPLFTRFQIETQIESAFAHTVHLPSGGSLVVDHTEALVSIDINSARATKGGDIEATALNTNLEAADEIARQLRLRDLGGLIVIDFIDMGPQKNQRDVENRLREAVRQDRARVQIGKISRFGLLEMSRQRLRPSLGESAYLTCPRCSGIGNIRSVESLALAILRIIGEEARKERTAKVIAQLPVEVATYLLNEKRDWVQNMEARHDTLVVLVANEALETPHYRIRRVRDDQVELPENTGSSYQLIDPEEPDSVPDSLQESKPPEAAAVTTVVTTPAPPREEPRAPRAPGFLARLAALFAGSEDGDKDKKPRRTTGKKKKPAKRGARQTDSRSASRGKRGGEGRKEKEAGRPERKKASKKRGGKKKADKPDEKKKDTSQDKREKKPVQSAGDASRDEQKSGEQQKSGKRRSRGGRRRRKSADKGGETRGNEQPPSQSEPHDTANAGDEGSRRGNTERTQPPAKDKGEATVNGAGSEAQQGASAAEPRKPRRRPAAEPRLAESGDPTQAGPEPGGAAGPKRAAQESTSGSDRVAEPAAKERQPKVVEPTAAAAAASAAQDAAGADRDRSYDDAPAPGAGTPADGAGAPAGDSGPQTGARSGSKGASPAKERREMPPARPDSAAAESGTQKQSPKASDPDPAEKDAAPKIRPQGRLLPWEPQPPANEDKSHSDEGSAQQ